MWTYFALVIYVGICLFCTSNRGKLKFLDSFDLWGFGDYEGVLLGRSSVDPGFNNEPDKEHIGAR